MSGIKPQLRHKGGEDVLFVTTWPGMSTYSKWRTGCLGWTQHGPRRAHEYSLHLLMCDVLSCNFPNIIKISLLLTWMLLLLVMTVNWMTFNIFQSILWTIILNCPVENCSAGLAWLMFGTTRKGRELKTHYFSMSWFIK